MLDRADFFGADNCPPIPHLTSVACVLQTTHTSASEVCWQLHSAIGELPRSLGTLVS
jgi:hypothetical protein